MWMWGCVAVWICEYVVCDFVDVWVCQCVCQCVGGYGCVGVGIDLGVGVEVVCLYTCMLGKLLDR